MISVNKSKIDVICVVGKLTQKMRAFIHIEAHKFSKSRLSNVLLCHFYKILVQINGPYYATRSPILNGLSKYDRGKPFVSADLYHDGLRLQTREKAIVK